ncbi:uncharacterized protein Z518_00681 [Rhinocladiella mackenziei CBS 650.93]|uniref:Uncharacterized protein n=1 Tax=Rhinocladiella mackenziei CBS 650.93 TaxID=1442369 RepID=A0A0D2J1P2_9EURO|nr:uncharacterized protein Z518_00681 [Rhinocladiella mackenziei CBS 650.93]KIX09601.1 hypothetical protein Z518_00681 [Rhinocladiella mackenziei CBS 650.93]
MRYRTLLLFLLYSSFVLANVEKVIFVAPPAQSPPPDAGIDNLLLTPLSDGHPKVRTHINASFPTKESPKGTESWFLLEGLRPHRRYEVRVCWLATQPTSFWLYTHPVDVTFGNPSLLTALNTYSHARHAQLRAEDKQTLQCRKTTPSMESTFLFVQIFAAADYFSLNQTLMETVPPVAVDVILDPYILNVFPSSLLSITVYLVLISVGAWFLSGQVLHLLNDTCQNPARQRNGKV